MQQQARNFILVSWKNNYNLTTGKSFSKFLLPPKRKYFKNNFREMYDLKGSKKLLSSSEDRSIFEDLEGSKPRPRPRTWLSSQDQSQGLQKLSSRTPSRPPLLLCIRQNLY